MKKLTLAAIALSAAAASLVATPATAGPGVDGPSGFLCGFSAVTDPNPEADANDMTGEIDAGPATTDVPGTLVCTIQVNSNTHDGPDAVSKSFASDANGVIVGVQAASYSTAEDAQDSMCTSFVSASGTIYFDGDTWETSPTVECSKAVQGGTQDVWDIIDGAVCPVLASNSPAAGPSSSSTTYIDNEGDVFTDLNQNGISEAEAMDELFFDCPVYTFTIDDNSNPDAIDNGVIDV